MKTSLVSISPRGHRDHREFSIIEEWRFFSTIPIYLIKPNIAFKAGLQKTLCAVAKKDRIFILNYSFRWYRNSV